MTAKGALIIRGYIFPEYHATYLLDLFRSIKILGRERKQLSSHFVIKLIQL